MGSKLDLRNTERIKNSDGEVYELKTQEANWQRPANVHTGNFRYEVDTRYDNTNTYNASDDTFNLPLIYRATTSPNDTPENVDVKIYQNGTLISDLTDQSGDTIITMPSAGIYQVELIPISGSEYTRLVFDTHYTLINILSWGNITWSNMLSMFSGCSNLIDLPLDTPDLSQLYVGTGFFEGLRGTFSDCVSLNPTNDSINRWNTTGIQRFALAFSNCSSFNTPLDNWDLSSAIDTNSMFDRATSFNQDIGGWTTSNVEDMNSMFQKASSFNQDISSWDVSNVDTIFGMFEEASSFNQDISSWDVSNVEDMSSMFDRATSFNQDLSSWCVTNIGSEPLNFDRFASSWVLPRPVWGTCP